MNTRHRIADNVRSFVSCLTPTPVASNFVSKGTLTPKEFVEAGDQLVFKFPTWQWQRARPRRKVSWLPLEKQFLLTRNVPSRQRIADLDSSLTLNKALDEEDVDWLLPDNETTTTLQVLDVDDSTDCMPTQEIGNDFEYLSSGGDIPRSKYINECPSFVASQESIKARKSVSSLYASADPTDDLIDISSFNCIESMIQEYDPASAKSNSPTGQDVSKHPNDMIDSHILMVRSYDISITYDKYYQTPRIWFFGYDENGVPLEPDRIVEDIMTDYVAKTITIDPHPCTGVPTVSIHPCRHAAVMHKVVTNWLAAKREPRHDLALFVLLKFVASAVPTIDYDFTMDVDMAVFPQ